MILTSPQIDQAALERRTGWALKPQGACKGEICVPLSDDERTDARALAARLGMAVVEDRGLLAVGPESAFGRALSTAVAPDLTLPEFKGGELNLASLRGQKVLLLAWASW